MRQQENVFLGLDPAIRAGEREDFLARLGYRIWANNLGRTNAPNERGILEPLSHPIGPLDSAGHTLDC